MLVDRDATIEQLRLVVLAVLTRLAEQAVTDTPLQKEWREIESAEDDEISYCLAAARLGLDPYSEAVPYEGDILKASEVFSGRFLDDFLDGADPANIAQDIVWIQLAGSAIAQSERPAQREAIRMVQHELALSAHGSADPAYNAYRPWEIGWQQARGIRRVLGVDSAQPFDLGRLIASVDRKVDDSGLLAVGASTDQFDPVVVTGQRRTAHSRRFTLARALWHHVWDSQPLFLVTGAYTGIQKIERAFAAELLAPAEGISELLPGGPENASPEDIDQLAHKFRVSSMVVEHQLQNQLLVDVS